MVVRSHYCWPTTIKRKKKRGVEPDSKGLKSSSGCKRQLILQNIDLVENRDRPANMSGQTASVSWFVVLVCFLVRVSGGETDITAKPGESVVLPCEAEINIIYVEWRRGTDTVCETKNPDYIQCQIVSPSFMNRVHLTKAFKSGDASLILTNVNESDAGKYECYVKLSGGRWKKRNDELTPLNTINLKIQPDVSSSPASPSSSPSCLLCVSLHASFLCVLVLMPLFVVLLVKMFSPKTRGETDPGPVGH